jgi:hypothetical protein
VELATRKGPAVRPVPDPDFTDRRFRQIIRQIFFSNENNELQEKRKTWVLTHYIAVIGQSTTPEKIKCNENNGLKNGQKLDKRKPII